MPAKRHRASFEPIPPDFDVRTFVEQSDNFQYVDRIAYDMLKENGPEQFEKLIFLHVIIGGKPLVIDGFEEVLDPWTFTPSWLRDNHGDKIEQARNLTSKENIPLTIKHYLRHMGKLTDQYFEDETRYLEKTRQRIYLKDIDCPPVWHDKLQEHIPPSLFYLNESTGDVGGAGAMEEFGLRKGRGIAHAGDLMSSLPPEMRAENLMCYIGHEGTYTPAHREMCASLGQNIMVNASAAISEDGKPERPGSSIWFMTESKDRQVVSEYWLSTLGHDIEVENHFAQLAAWKKAPFTTYVVEQRPGDFILIPPLAPHQVWNRGTRTMKIAWNRTTVETLELALNEALPNSRVVCRDEQYKNKAIVYYTLLKYSALIKSARAQVELGGEQAYAIQTSLKVRQVQRDFKKLFDLYKNILLSEMFAPDSREHPEFIPFDSNVTCAYCRCNIFNRFMTCKSCKNMFSKDIEEPYDVCMDCYCMGRSCGCQSGYTWVEQWKWKDLLHKYEEWRAQIIDIDGHMTEKTPLPLQEERRYFGKKTLAQVCQEQLKLRPFIDPNAPKPVEEKSDDEEIQVNDDGTVKKTTKKKSKQWLRDNKSCHFCLHRHPKWKMAFCSNCDLAYCYGTLFRAHDLMPLTTMENPSWACPHCTRTCNTGACRRDPRQHPYEPRGTLLGHDTKKVADPRSTECLVDFSISNLNWLRDDEETGPMKRRQDDALRAKQLDPTMDHRFMDDVEHDRSKIQYSPVEDIYGDNANGNGYVDPSVVFPEDSQMQDVENSYFADPDMNGDIPRLGKRSRDVDDNSRKKKKKQKKKRDEEPQPRPPQNVSGKQYQKEVERKLLEEAKRNDRMILVMAKMKSKSKVVKLSLPSDLLEAIQQRPGAQQSLSETQIEDVEHDHPVTDRSIIQSDILPRPAVADMPGQKPKLPSSFRVRVEEDESYGSKRRQSSNPTAKVGQPGQRPRRYEELTLDSDEDLEFDDFADFSLHGNGQPKPRSSAWLARKNEGEEDLPTELPPDFKDGMINPRTDRERERERERKERRKTMPAKPKTKPGQRPRGRPRRSTGDLNGEDEADNESALLLAQSAAAALADREAEEARVAAQKEAEENLRAKMALFNGDPIADAESGDSEGEINEDLDNLLNDFAAHDEPLYEEREELPSKLSQPPLRASVQPPSKPPSQPSRASILEQASAAGKKIKIVGSKRNVEPPVASFTTINKGRKKTINLSEDSESDGEIPAKAPVPKAAVPKTGRGLVPTRGGNTRGRGRGRGRPKKTT